MALYQTASLRWLIHKEGAAVGNMLLFLVFEMLSGYIKIQSTCYMPQKQAA